MFRYYPLVFLLILFWTITNDAQQTSEGHFEGDEDQKSQETNETSGYLSAIWSTLTTFNKTSACPGECVHAITSLFCDKVLEDISCGSLSRCCISNSQYYSMINNMPSINGDSPSTESTPITTVTTTESFSVISNNHHWYTTTTNRKYQETTTAATTTSTTEASSPFLYSNIDGFESIRDENNSARALCPVSCTKFGSYCLGTLRSARCPNPDEQCCIESEPTMDPLTKNFIKLVQQTLAKNQTKNIGTEFNAISSTTSTSTTTVPPLPPCDGTCVIALFHMLCDEIDHSQHCSNGYCCVNREPTTQAPQITTCDGTCLPTVLSGMCTKPNELVLKTIECGTGTICCAYGKNLNQPNQIYNNENTNPTDNNQAMPPMLIPPQISSYPSTSLASNPVLSIPPRVPVQPKPVLPYPVSPPLMIDNKVHFRPPPNLNENPIKSGNDESTGAVPPMIDTNFIRKEIFGCPGKCINSMFKFTCLAGYSTYKNFKCPKGQICCASNSEMEKFEIFLHNTKMAQQQQHLHPQSPMNSLPPPSKPILPPQSQPLQPPPSPSNPLPNTMENKIPVILNHPPPPPLPPPPPPPPLPQPANIIINQTLDLLASPPSQPALVPHGCGIKGSKISSRVVGGSDSYPGEWCWQIALVNQQNQYICGGALIGRQWALTAAHCVTSYVRKNEPILVRAGEYDLTRNNRLAQTQKVTTIYVHHNHNSQSLDNDIALLKLQAPVDLNGHTCLVCLPTWNLNVPIRNRHEIKRCTVTGYGFQYESGPIALRIREAQIPIVDDQECITKINSVTEKLFTLPASSFCAGGRGGNDACQGDGGSGLVCQSDGFYELTGLVSWGFGCGRNGVPGVYVKVSSFVGWINQIVSTNAN